MLSFVSIYQKKTIQNLFNLKDRVSILSKKCLHKIQFEVSDSYFFVSKSNDRATVFFTNENISKHVIYNNKNNTFNFFSGGIVNNQKFLIDSFEVFSNYKAKDCIYDVGNYFMGQVGENNDVFMQNVLGTYELYFGENENCTVVSDNPYLVSIFLENDSLIKVNYFGLLAQMITRMSWGCVTNLLNVYRFPGNSICVVDTNNQLSFRLASKILYKDMTVSQWLNFFDETYENLISSMIAISNLRNKDELICSNITGGFDSRVSLALVIASKTQDYHEFITRKYSDTVLSSDIKVSRLIKQELPFLNIKEISHNDFYSDFNLRTKSDFLENITAGEVDAPSIKILFHNAQSEKVFIANSNGIMGEAIRGYISTEHRWEVGGNLPINCNSGFDCFFLKKEAKDELFHLTANIFNKMQSSYNLDILFSYSWLSRFHLGLLRRNIFGPLCNPLLHNLASTSLPEFRMANIAIFKIIERACPKLLKIPFADKRWNPLAYIGRSDAREFVNIPKIASDDHFVSYAENTYSQSKEEATNILKNINSKFFDFIDEEKWNFLLNKNEPFNNYKLMCLAYPALLPNVIDIPIFKKNSEISITSKNITEQNLYSVAQCELDQYLKIQDIFSTKDVLSKNYVFLFGKDTIFDASYEHLSEKQTHFYNVNMNYKIKCALSSFCNF